MTLRPWMIVATIGAAAFAFGAVYAWAYWPLAVVSFALGVVGLRSASGGPSPVGRWWLGLTAVAAAMALQLVPLPRAWFLALTPSADRLLGAYSFAYANDPPRWHTLSIDPMATLVALALFVAFAVLLMGVAVACTRMRLDQLAGGLTGLGVALSIVAVLQKALQPDDPHNPIVYGFWHPIFGGNPFGPFINRNHFAGWMVMALPLAVGYAFGALEEARHPVRPGAGEWIRWLATPEASRVAFIGFSVIVMGTAIVLSGSRSGIASLLVAGVALVVFASYRLGRPAVRWLAILALVAAIAAILAWAGFDQTMARFSLASHDLPGRLGAWRDTMRIIRDFPIFGTGLGTYVDAMLVYQTGDRQLIFFQAHNDYLQLAAEGGVLVAVPVVAAVVMMARTIRRRFVAAEDAPLVAWLRRGAVAGIVGIAAQSVVEFSLQLPANCALLMVLAAIALHRPSVTHARRV